MQQNLKGCGVNIDAEGFETKSDWKVKETDIKIILRFPPKPASKGQQPLVMTTCIRLVTRTRWMPNGGVAHITHSVRFSDGCMQIPSMSPPCEACQGFLPALLYSSQSQETFNTVDIS